MPDERRPAGDRPVLRVAGLGRMAYGAALDLQRAAARARADGRIRDDLLLLVEHPPVLTLGRSAKASHVRASQARLAQQGIEVFEVERGGDVTFHGPGQLVGYPILDLRQHRQDLHWYLRQLEEVLIVALADFGIAATRNPGYTGVWTGDADRAPSLTDSGLSGAPGSAGVASLVPPGSTGRRKIASIGVHSRDWVTRHGFALNVATDLSYFDLIVPCGIDGVSMTSMARETGRSAIGMEDVAAAVVHAFEAVFALHAIPVDTGYLIRLGELDSAIQTLQPSN